MFSGLRLVDLSPTFPIFIQCLLVDTRQSHWLIKVGL